MGGDEANNQYLEMIRNLRDDLKDVKNDLQTTREQIRKYNGLKEDMSDYLETQKKIWDKVTRLEDQDEAKNEMSEKIRAWINLLISISGWLVALISLLIKFA